MDNDDSIHREGEKTDKDKRIDFYMHTNYRLLRNGWRQSKRYAINFCHSTFIGTYEWKKKDEWVWGTNQFSPQVSRPT
jgi:hypothetical protein